MQSDHLVIWFAHQGFQHIAGLIEVPDGPDRHLTGLSKLKRPAIRAGAGVC